MNAGWMRSRGVGAYVCGCVRGCGLEGYMFSAVIIILYCGFSVSFLFLSSMSVYYYQFKCFFRCSVLCIFFIFYFFK